MDKLYLVTGATGHLGSAVIRQLIQEGKIVRALVLPSEKHIPGQVEVYSGDVRNKESIKPCFENLNGSELIVIHCAGIVSIASAFDQAVYDVNVTGTRNVVDLCTEYRVSKLIYVSSVHAIPEKPAGTLITEVTDFSAEKVVGSYAKTKAEATSYVLVAAKQGLNACVVHPSGIVGPYDFGRGHITAFIIDYWKGKIISCVRGGYDFVDVRDVANGIILCSEKGRQGECYILANKFFEVGEILDMLHEITGKKKIEHFLPLGFARAMAPLSELYCKISGKPPLFTTYSIDTLNSNALFSHQKAKDDLGYTTRNMKQTLADTVAWLKEVNRI